MNCWGNVKEFQKAKCGPCHRFVSCEMEIRRIKEESRKKEKLEIPIPSILYEDKI